jgi:uncharacterized membrane protein
VLQRRLFPLSLGCKLRPVHSRSKPASQTSFTSMVSPYSPRGQRFTFHHRTLFLQVAKGHGHFKVSSIRLVGWCVVCLGSIRARPSHSSVFLQFHKIFGDSPGQMLAMVAFNHNEGVRSSAYGLDVKDSLYWKSTLQGLVLLFRQAKQERRKKASGAPKAAESPDGLKQSTYLHVCLVNHQTTASVA